MTISRSLDGPEPNEPPIGERAGCQPKKTPPTTNAHSGSNAFAATQSEPATMSFCFSSLDLGTGCASRYRRDDQLASLATVSPQNRATTTTSRNPTDANSVKRAKLKPPEVARPTSCGASLPAPPPTSKAVAMMIGSTMSSPNATWVRRRFSCRTNSTRSLSVCRGLKSGARPASSSASRAWMPRRVAANFESSRSDTFVRGSDIALSDQFQEDVLEGAPGRHRFGDDAGGGQHARRLDRVRHRQLQPAGAGDLRGRPGRDQPSLVHDDDVRVGLLHFGEQVARHDDRPAGAGVVL